MISLCSKKNTGKDGFTSEEVIDEIFNDLKKGRITHVFPGDALVYDIFMTIVMVTRGAFTRWV